MISLLGPDKESLRMLFNAEEIEGTEEEIELVAHAFADGVLSKDCDLSDFYDDWDDDWDDDFYDDWDDDWDDYWDDDWDDYL